MLVVDCEERALQRREHRKLVVGPFDCGEGGPNGLHLFPTVERLATDQEVRHTTRLDGVGIGSRDIGAEAHEPPEEKRYVPRLDRDLSLRSVRRALGNGPTV